MTKPILNNAVLQTFATYRAVYDVSCVDEKQKIWKGRPVVGASMSVMPGGGDAVEHGWIYFSRIYSDTNDWDKVYPEFEFNGDLIGSPFLLIPKEKILFGYNPPTEGILLPPPGKRFKIRRN